MTFPKNESILSLFLYKIIQNKIGIIVSLNLSKLFHVENSESLIEVVNLNIIEPESKFVPELL